MESRPNVAKGATLGWGTRALGQNLNAEKSQTGPSPVTTRAFSCLILDFPKTSLRIWLALLTCVGADECVRPYVGLPGTRAVRY